MSQIVPSPSEALALAKTVLMSRFAGASFAFVAGSIMRGQGTHMSDIDLVVVYERLESAWRESFIIEGVPVEALIHDKGTLAWFINDDVERGRPSILNMVADGTVIGDSSAGAESIRQEVLKRLSAGPRKLTPAELNVIRYEITDLIDDLRGDRTPSEVLAIGAALHGKLVDLSLRGRRRWTGAGKWAARLIKDADDSLENSFEDAFRKLFASGDCDPVIALADAELEPHGGRLFEGYCRHAPASWRV